MMMVIARVVPVNQGVKKKSTTQQFHWRGWKGKMMGNRLVNKMTIQMRRWTVKEVNSPTPNKMYIIIVIIILIRNL